MPELKGPRNKTLKRLFAVSGNRCAFPNCENTIVDPTSGTVVGVICHIKAQSPDGPRYDPSQTDEERHGFDNLLLMCPIHHRIIDSDPESYTVPRLKEIKAKHEALHTGGTEPSDDIINQLQFNINSVSIQYGKTLRDEQYMIATNWDGKTWGGRTSLRGFDLSERNLSSAHFENANLIGANFSKADLRQANLRGANLREVNFQGANLERAWLHQADLSGANLSETNLNGAFLSGAKVTAEQLRTAKSLTRTQMPDGTIHD